MSLPKLYSQFISRRRKRSLHPYEAPVGEVGSLKVEVGQRRVKRQDDGADRRLFLNDDTMDVDIGFLLGGASQYNITQTISDVMRVARDPFISRFKDDIYSYRLYSPYNEEELAIQVSPHIISIIFRGIVLLFGSFTLIHTIVYARTFVD